MKKSLLYPVLVFAISFAIYAPTLSGGFYYDDNVIFLGHQAKHLSGKPFSVFKSDAHRLPGTPRSLHVFFLLLIYKISGTEPLAYHIFNLIFHSLTAVLVFLLARRLTKKDSPALWAGLIFGLHPVHVENLTFVTLGGTDLFYTFWAVLSLYLYLIFREKGGFLYLLLSVVTYCLAIFSKESAISFIFAYPLVELYLRRRGFLWALPHLTALTVLKLGVLSGGVETVIKGATGRGARDVILSLGYFVKSLILPYPLSPIIKDFPHPTLLYFSLLVFALIAIVFVLRKNSLGILGIGLLTVASVPYLFVPFVSSNVAITADRYIYPASFGFALMLGSVVELIKNIRLRWGAMISILALYAVMGIVYFQSAWSTEEAFWRYSAKMNPEQVSSYISLASIEIGHGNREEARRLLLEGLGKPKGLPAEYAQAAHMLGSLEAEAGRLNQAESYWLLAIKHSPYEFAFIDLGILYLNTGNPEKARWAFESALMFPQRSPRAVLGLAKSLQMLGDIQGARNYAIEVYNRAKDEALRAAAEELLRGLK